MSPEATEPDSATAAERPIDVRNPLVAGILAWAIPGLGHVYQGRLLKGVLFFVCILGLFLAGLEFGDYRVVYWRELEPGVPERSMKAMMARAPSICQLGAGLVALPSVLHERGWLPDWVAPYAKRPTEAELDDTHRRLGKQVDIALVYTMVAGLLNLLVIFDACAGPALHAEERKYLAEQRAKRDAVGGNDTEAPA